TGRQRDGPRTAWCEGRRASGLGGLGLFRPPREEGLTALVLAHGAAVHAELEQVLVGAADERAGPHAERRHDLAAVERGTDRGDLLRLGERRDALLEIVVGGAQPRGLALVARRAVGAR